jgi:membrane protease YdiL (CAAX protease family)
VSLDSPNLNDADFVLAEAIAAEPDARELLLPTRGHNDLPRLAWRWDDVLLAVGFLVAWRVGATYLQAVAADWPSAIVLLLTGVLPTLFITLFPLWAYRRAGGTLPIRFPAFSRLLLEAVLAVPVVIALLMALSLVGLVWSEWSGEQPEMDGAMHDLVHAQDARVLGLFALMACLWAPVGEELFFRGYLQNALGRWLPLWVAALLQALLFAGVHHYSGIHFAGIAVIALGLTAHYLWRKSVFATMFVHAGLNGIVTLMLVAFMTLAANAPVLGVALEPEAERCVIREVQPDSAAAEAGLRAGDVIVSLDDQPIATHRSLEAQLALREPEATVTLVVDRGGELVTISAVLRARTTSR